MSEAKNAPGRWHRLDNTANIFPVITSKKFSNVYRLSVNLTEDIDPEPLQQALEKTLPHFAALEVRLRRGLFWHYLEANAATPLVSEEDDYPCQYIDPLKNNNFLFTLTYYGTRINLEVFHVLTDGTAGMRFLLAICCQYLMLVHPGKFSEEEKAKPWLHEWASNTEDSYAANYAPAKKSTFRIGRAYKLKGERTLLQNPGLIQAYVNLPGLLAVCRKKQVSISQYIVACIAWAIFTQQMKSRPSKQPVNIFIPVNLRSLFDSTTALNFFSNIYISLPFDTPNITFESVLAEVKKQFDEKISKEAMLEKISYTVGSGYSPFVRIVPLVLKKLALRAIFEVSAKSSSLSFSNLGKISVPSPFEKYVTGAAVLLSTAPREPFKCAACSYGDTLILSFTSVLRNVALQREILRQMANDGIDITIETNEVDNANL